MDEQSLQKYWFLVIACINIALRYSAIGPFSGNNTDGVIKQIYFLSTLIRAKKKNLYK